MRAILISTDQSTATGETFEFVDSKTDRTFQATVAGTGAVTGVAVIEVSNDRSGYLTLGTITLSGTTSATDGFASTAPWAFVRAKITGLTGTGAVITVSMGA